MKYPEAKLLADMQEIDAVEVWRLDADQDTSKCPGWFIRFYFEPRLRDDWCRDLMTQRGDLRRFASIDAAYWFAQELGVETVEIEPGPERR